MMGGDGMSVLIKGIGIPKSCGRCWFNNSSLSCAITGSCIDRDDENRERLDDCPLVDLGKHGDLIDRDELRAEFPEPIDIIDPQQALVHITGVWAEIDCADVVIEAEDK